MAHKRKREETLAESPPVKIQKPEKPIIDPHLVQIYAQLAEEKESKRIKAATQLLQKLQEESTTQKDVERALRRLILGLCSARKAARQGFSVALTELLAQIASKKIDVPLSSEQLIDLLESATTPDSSATKQEARDHLLGLVFAADAIIKSGILTQRNDRSEWKRLIAALCTASLKKVWLRQETGWMLYQFAESVAAAATTPDELQFFLEHIIDALSTHKLIRTSEGVAIWLSATKSLPDAKLLKHVWKHGHPLAAKDLNTLADIMKDARGRSNDEQAMEAQGAAVWSASLHFAWKVVLAFLLDPTATRTKDLVSFADFWSVVVDQGLFDNNSSPERKQTGFSVLISAAQAAPLDLLPQVCSKNVVHCLLRGLTDEDAYLHKVCERAKKTIESRLLKLPDVADASAVPAACLDAVFRSAETQDLDRLSKSKFLFRLGMSGNDNQRISIIATFNKLSTEAFADKKRYRYILDFQAKFLASLIRDSAAKLSEDDVQQVLKPLSSWFNILYASHDDLNEDFKTFVRSRVDSVMEQCLRAGPSGQSIFISCVENGIVLPLRDGQIKSNKQIRKMINSAFTKDATSGDVGQALKLLYCTIIMDVADGEAESIESLQALIEMDDLQTNADAITEVLLSLAPRPSKFLRSVSRQVFEATSPYLTQDGLDPLTRVLLTKENAKGQQEIFGSAEDEEVEGDLESDGDEVDSDVEVLDAPDSDSSSDSDADSDPSTSGDDSEDDDQVQEDGETGDADDNSDGADDEQLAAFDAALASALGTRKLEQGKEEVESSDSDADMDDDEMIALDEKLAEVFRARKEASSKKKERKDTKEAFIHFKNRVLDLVEVYLKNQYRNGLAAKLVLPVLQSVRVTQNKQIADRTGNILRTFFAKCKGKDVPKVSKDDVADILSQFRQVHKEACQESSNAHASVASAASILLVKVLLAAGTDIDVLVDEYGNTRKRQLTDKACRVQPSFFNDWNNWCAQARSQLAK
ncbi:hypothetical protein DV738_g5487, partial [Chaetothyriales sp. CBS 135597]